MDVIRLLSSPGLLSVLRSFEIYRKSRKDLVGHALHASCDPHQDRAWLWDSEREKLLSRQDCTGSFGTLLLQTSGLYTPCRPSNHCCLFSLLPA